MGVNWQPMMRVDNLYFCYSVLYLSQKHLCCTKRRDQVTERPKDVISL